MILHARREDAPLLARMECEAWGKPNLVEYATWTWASIIRNGLVLKAVVQGEIVGVVALESTISGTGHINIIIVKSEHRRKGIGRRLLEKLMEGTDPAPLHALIATGNIISQHLFREMGFTKTEYIGHAYCSQSEFDKWVCCRLTTEQRLKEESERLKTLVEAYRTHWRRAYVGRPPFDTEMKPW
jgi:ribosomal protein S18 acetylase RimI-like enzyme